MGGGAIRIINDPISFSSAGSCQPGLHCCLSGKPERGGHRLLLPHQKVLHTHIKMIMIIITTIITIDITIIKVQQKVLHTHEKFTWNFCVRIHQIFQFLGSSQYWSCCRCFEFACEANFRKATIPEYKREYEEIEDRSEETKLKIQSQIQISVNGKSASYIPEYIEM